MRWSRKLLIIVVAVLLCIPPVPALAERDDYASYMDAGAAAYKAGDFAAAEKAYRAAARLAEGKGIDTPEEAAALYKLGKLYVRTRNYGRAESRFKRVLSIDERLHGLSSQYVADVLLALADLYYEQARYPEAESRYKQAVAIEEKILGPDHRFVATDLGKLADVYQEEGRYREAEQLYDRVLAIKEKLYGRNDPSQLATLNSLAGLYQLQGRYTKAESLFQRALTVAKAAGGKGALYIPAILNNLASLYIDEGRYAEAVQLSKRALALNEQYHGPEHPRMAVDLNNLAEAYRSQGRYTEAELLYKRALSIDEKALGSEHPTVAVILNNLAATYRSQGHYVEAEPLFKRALEIKEKIFGHNHSAVASSLNNLAVLYMDQGRYAEAEPLYRRAAAIDEKALGADHPAFAIDLNNLATLYHLQGRNDKAVPLYQRALVIEEKAFGSKHPEVATTLGNLAGAYEGLGRYAKAESLYRRALAIEEAALGPADIEVATELNNLALLYARQGRLLEAEPLFKRALSINQKALGSGHPTVAANLNNLSLLYSAQGRYAEARRYSARAVAILSRRELQGADSRSNGAERERRKERGDFIAHVSNISHTLGEGAARATSVNEAFETAQLASAQGAAQALAQMAARFAAGSDAMAKLVRERQDLLDQWRALDKRLIEAASAPPARRHADVEQRLRRDLAAADSRLKALDARLAKDFPDYAALANPRPVSVNEIQQLLHPDEAMVKYLVGIKTSYLWVVTKKNVQLFRLDIGQAELAKQVKRLRRGLDQQGIHNLDDLRAFDVKRAYKLYQQLLAPAASQLQGIKTLLLVPDGPLQSLPFAVLVTEAPKIRPHRPGDYRDVPWLINRYALATLPSAGSLKALRRFARNSQAPDPFVGFGDPTLGKRGGATRGLDARALFSRGGLADLKHLRELPSLPETAQELRTLAKTLKAANDTVYLQSRATETQVDRLPLSRYRVVAFATHGLLAGEFQGQGEPALVLTPPKQATVQDDGLLTASEVAQLKLNADWVILSACNTAAADGTPGAEGLTGLAKAFFYAGSRALLVSNWSVSSQAAEELTTTLFKRQAAEPGLGDAEALREAMQAVRDDPKHPYFAHPYFWAPFIVVGAGE